MTIETKYSIGDSVYLIAGTVVAFCTVKAIRVIVYRFKIYETQKDMDKIQIVYELNELEKEVLESNLFPTKEALIESL